MADDRHGVQAVTCRGCGARGETWWPLDKPAESRCWELTPGWTNAVVRLCPECKDAAPGAARASRASRDADEELRARVRDLAEQAERVANAEPGAVAGPWAWSRMAELLRFALDAAAPVSASAPPTEEKKS
jgi:hypothetical protein